jgi:hypothetical protein
MGGPKGRSLAKQLMRPPRIEIRIGGGGFTGGIGDE